MSETEASVPPHKHSAIWLILGRVLAVIVPLAIAVIAFIVLHSLASETSWADLSAAIANQTRVHIAGAIVATFISLAAVSQLDPVSLSAMGARVPWIVATATGAAASAVSNMLGFSWLTGMSVRYRVYAARGIDVARFSGALGVSWSTYALAMILLTGLLLLWRPQALADLISLSPTIDTVIGVAYLALTAFVFLWLWLGPSKLHVGKWQVTLPAVWPTIKLTFFASLDLAATAMVLWFLLPENLGVGPVQFFIIFLVALLLGVISHSPGGLGVFEATIVAGLGTGSQADVLAALILYRIIYTLTPFVLAMLGLTTAWLITRRQQGAEMARAGYAMSLPFAPPLAAALTTLCGIVLLVAGSLPPDAERLQRLADQLPLAAIETSHLAASVAGVLLIVVARGLWQRMRRAWIAALVFIALGILTSLMRGLDWTAAWILLVAGLVLVAAGPAFYRRGGNLRVTGGWLLSCVALLAMAVWVGFVAHSDASLGSDLWWQVEIDGDASRFLRASLAAAIVLGAVAMAHLVGRDGALITAQPIPDAVRRLVAESPDTEPSMALLGDKAFLVSEDDKAFLSYGDTGRALITKGDPVGDAVAGRDLVWQLRDQADRMGRVVGFYAVTPKWLPTYIDVGLEAIKFGEVARVDLPNFTMDGKARKDMRYYVNRAKREGYAFEIIPRDRIGDEIEALRAVSEAWRHAKSGQEKGFALGRFDPTFLANFDHAVYRETASGRIVAFANILRGAGQHEVSVDLMRYDPDVKVINMEGLFAELMVWSKDQGYRWFNLGATPFSGLESRGAAPTWSRMGDFIYRHGEHFFSFQGLHEFKCKFDPVWTGNYVAAANHLAAMRVLYEVNQLISGGFRGAAK
ncbi:MAG: bifunctional lysylphosphatidylglycerol flippase/synthetase MprF [Pseudomonadota bacterium]